MQKNAQLEFSGVAKDTPKPKDVKAGFTNVDIFKPHFHIEVHKGLGEDLFEGDTGSL